MMTTLNKIIYEIWELLRKSQITDDIDIDEREIIHKINLQRSLWIRNELNKPGRSIDHNIIQDLGCVELEEVDPIDCCELNMGGCIVLRTKNVIPNTIELHNGTAITRVGPVDKTDISFSFVPYERSVFSGNSKYSKKQVYAYLLNNRIYLKVTDPKDAMMTHINIRGVFEDPTEAAKFIDCDDQPCFTYDSKYPINTWMINYLKEQVLAQFGASMNMPKDDASDANETLKK